MNSSLVVVLVIAVVLSICSADSDEHSNSTKSWGYEDTDETTYGPSYWYKYADTCNGTKQSPIDIMTSTAQIMSGVTMSFSGYDSVSSGTFTFKNNGHSVQVNTNNHDMRVTKTDLPGANYILEQFHFHWGKTDNTGSEHKVDGMFYPTEIHFVHYNSAKYDNVTHAVKAGANDASALLVVGAFGQVVASHESPMSLDKLIGLTANISNNGESVQIQAFELGALLPNMTGLIYTYNGSLTTPTCNEIVNWNIFATPIYVTETELNKLRVVHGHSESDTLDHNYRPVQALNGRILSEFNADGSAVVTGTTNTATGTSTTPSTTTASSARHLAVTSVIAASALLATAVVSLF